MYLGFNKSFLALYLQPNPLRKRGVWEGGRGAAAAVMRPNAAVPIAKLCLLWGEGVTLGWVRG